MGTTSGGDRPWQSYNTVYTNAKAGMDGVDKEKVQRIVYEMSKGSKYFENEKRKEEFIKQRIENLREQYTKLTKEDASHFQEIANRKMIELEASRDLSKIWLHSDMDAFYAAVETLGNPSMKGKPLAVGSMSMLCTANYEARKFGVRAAMPGFIARKLCPELIFVPPKFDKYTYYSELTRKVFRRYDPNFIASSLDEAYLNITDICNERGISSEEVAVELRNAIYEETGLTCSCGVAPNRLLAKVCSDINKPNGQFILPNDRKAVMIFIASLPIRKIGGIGKVTEHVLRDVLAVNTCEEMLQNSAYLCALFSACSTDFFISVGLGLGRTDTPQYNQRKSISCERTFSAIEDESLLFQKLADISNTLSNDMLKECLCGRTLTLKLKTSSFDVRTRAVSLQKHICSKEDILYYASKLLKAELPLSLRLMGLRMSHFHDDKQGPSDPMQKTLKDFINRGVASSNVSNVSESTGLDIDVKHLMNNGDTNLSIGEGSCYSNGDSGFSLSNEFEDLLESDQLPPVCKDRADNDAGGTKNLDDVCPVKSEPSRPKGVNETANHKVEPISVDCICSVCGLELPLSFTEEMQEHTDYHLAERLQAEESVNVSRPLEDLHERLTKKPLNSREISRKRRKHSPKEERHIPIDAFFVKRDKNPTNSNNYFSGE